MKEVERFLKLKSVNQKVQERHGMTLVAERDLVNDFLSTDVNSELIAETEREINDFYNFECKISVTQKEVDELLSIIEKEFDDQKFNALISSCRTQVLSSIVGPFGLGFLVAKFDKNGGNVTTSHNFKDGVVATDQDRQRYSEWKKSTKDFDREPYDYDIKLNRKGEPVTNKDGKVVKIQFNSRKKRDIFNRMRDGEFVIDGYTGRKLGKKEGNQIKKNTRIDLEHITSIKEIETDPKNHLFARGQSSSERLQDRVTLARNDNNLTLTEGRINSSKGSDDLIEWANRPSIKDPSKTNAEYFGADPKLLEREYKKSKDFLKKEILKRQIEKQSKEIATTGALEGFKMGKQQALGLLLCEFFSSVFDELHDIYNNGFSNGFESDKFYHVLRKRLSRIAERIAARWKDVCTAFKDGFISGFLSNLVTVLINTFFTTGKRLVRIIREGFFTLLRAIKKICFPPEGMTLAEAAHEALKLIAAGITVAGGILIEEEVHSMLASIPLLGHYSTLVGVVLVGALTAIATTFIVYAIDKIDLLKANDKEKHEFIMNRLEQNLERLFCEGEELIQELSFDYN